LTVFTEAQLRDVGMSRPPAPQSLKRYRVLAKRPPPDIDDIIGHSNRPYITTHGIRCVDWKQ